MSLITKTRRLADRVFQKYKEPVKHKLKNLPSNLNTCYQTSEKLWDTWSKKLKKDTAQLKKAYLKELEKIKEWERKVAVRNRKIAKEETLALQEAQQQIKQSRDYVNAEHLVPFRDDYEDLIQLLHKHNITKVYHFTDRSNWPLIQRAKGLLSAQEIRKNKIQPIWGGSEASQSLDRKKGWNYYIHLSFCKNHPMSWQAFKIDGRIKDLMILEIDTTPLFWESTMFTNMNAIKNSVLVIKTIKELEENVNLAVTQESWCSRSNEADFNSYQAEILVRDFIPLECIKLCK